MALTSPAGVRDVERLERSPASLDLDEHARPRAERRRRFEPTRIALAGGVVALTGASLAMRAQGIGQWYWLDEALSIGIASHAFTEIPRLLVADGSPPLYYWLLHGWTQLFGTGETATHALSLLFAVVAVPVAWWAGNSLFGRRTGWLVAVLAATNPFLTYFARETRMYILLVLLGMVASTAFVRGFVRSERRHLVVFGVVLVLMLYTHNWALYTTVAALAALVPCWLVATDRRRLVRQAAVVFGTAGLAYLPWVPTLLAQVRHTGAPWAHTPSFRNLITEVSALVRDERVLIALLLAAGVGLAPLIRRPRTPDQAALFVLVSFVAVPIAIGWAIANVEPSWATRYLAVVVGPALVLVGWGLARAGGLGIAALLIALALWVQPLARMSPEFTVPVAGKSDAKALSEMAGRFLNPGDVVVVGQPEAVPLFAHYLEGDELRFADLMGPVDNERVVDWRDIVDRLRASSFADGVGPMVDELPIGGRVLLVLPSRGIAPSDTGWIQDFHGVSEQVWWTMHNDSEFRWVRPLRPNNARGAWLSYRAHLYERIEPGLINQPDRGKLRR